MGCLLGSEGRIRCSQPRAEVGGGEGGHPAVLEVSPGCAFVDWLRALR